MAVQRQWGSAVVIERVALAGLEAGLVWVSVRSRRMARARTLGPRSTTTVISSMPSAGEVVMTRLSFGRLAVARTGLSWLILRRALMLVHGASWLRGRVPARVSARAWANWLGQGPAEYRSAK